MNYSHLIDNMRWSYSRIKSFEMCPHMFYLSYIEKEKKIPMFFSDFGSYIHHILELYLKGLINKDELVDYYLTRYTDKVIGKAPNAKMYENYLNQGLEYFKDFEFPFKDIKDVEWKSEFKVGKYDFVGVVDVIVNDNNQLCIVDHKSHNLKPYSHRKKPTKGDEELDEYLRQLYLYAIPVAQKYGRFPDFLIFNCFRTGTIIREPFKEERFKEVCQWAIDTIKKIRENENWKPEMDFWQCKYICDLHDTCEYYQINWG